MAKKNALGMIPRFKALGIIARFQEHVALNGVSDRLLDYVWNDWFCSEKSLNGRAKVLVPIVLGIKGSSGIDLETDYVFFKNNCPGNGSLYDSISICDSTDGTVKVWIGHKCSHSRLGTPNNTIPKWTINVYGDNGYETEIYFNRTKDAISYINTI